jgi:D-mannonate dehydratase
MLSIIHNVPIGEVWSANGVTHMVTHISESAQNGMMISATDSNPFQENMQHQPSDHGIPCEKSTLPIQSKTTHDDDTKIYRKNETLRRSRTSWSTLQTALF